MSDNGHANGTPAPIPPEVPKFVELRILVNPSNIAENQILHPGLDRPAVLQVLAAIMSVVAAQHAMDLRVAQQKKIELAPATALRALPRIAPEG